MPSNVRVVLAAAGPAMQSAAAAPRIYLRIIFTPGLHDRRVVIKRNINNAQFRGCLPPILNAGDASVPSAPLGRGLRYDDRRRRRSRRRGRLYDHAVAPDRDRRAVGALLVRR